MNGQSQLEKGDFAAAQWSLDAVIKADPTSTLPIISGPKYF
jgi:Tfp pilus assembly protein PilF